MRGECVKRAYTVVAGMKGEICSYEWRDMFLISPRKGGLFF